MNQHKPMIIGFFLLLITYTLFFVSKGDVLTSPYDSPVSTSSDATPSDAETEESIQPETIPEEITTEETAMEETSPIEETTEEETSATEEIPLTPAVFETNLDANELVVYSYLELKNTLQSATDGITTIYLGSDIIMTDGILVNASKTNVVLDGTWDGVTHTLTEVNSAVLTKTIYLDSSAIQSFTLKNIAIYGYNYYGTVGVRAANADVTITYDTITYTGPQIAYNTLGRVIFKDCDITLKKTGVSEVQELAETSNVEFSGKVDLYHSSLNSVLWYYSDGEMIVRENADVTITSPLSNYGMLYNRNVAIVLEKNASFKFLSSKPRFSYTNNIVSSLIMEENSNLYMEFNGTTALSQFFNLNGEAIIKSGAEFKIKSSTPVTDSLIYGAKGNMTIDGGKVSIEQSGNVTSRLLYQKSITIIKGDFSVTSSAATHTNGLYYLEGLTVEAEGSFHLSVRNNTHTYLLHTGDITINGGTFKAISQYNTAPVLIQSTGNIRINPGSTFQAINKAGSASQGVLNITNATKNIEISDPKNVVLYDSAGSLQSLIHYAAAQPFNMSADQINYWTHIPRFPAAGTLDAPPIHQWKKQDGSAIFVNGRFAPGAKGAYTFLSSNYIAGDGSASSPSSIINRNTFTVLSLGELPFHINDLNTNKTHISGHTAPNANIRITYNGIVHDFIADNNGNFSYPLERNDTDLPITIEANHDFLYATYHTTLDGVSGALTLLEVPTTLEFKDSVIPANASSTIERQSTDWTITVEDQRSVKTNWKLQARLLYPLTPVDSDYAVPLENALVFVDANNQKHYLSTTESISVYESNDGNELTNITWGSRFGLLAEIRPGMVYSGVQYKAGIQWILQDAP